MSEPKLLFCGVRQAIDENDIPEYHIECRFADGQKRAAVKVDGEFPGLANLVAELLNGTVKIPEATARQFFDRITTRSDT